MNLPILKILNNLLLLIDIQESLMNSKLDHEFKSNHFSNQLSLIKTDKETFEEKCKKLNVVSKKCSCLGNVFLLSIVLFEFEGANNSTE